MAMLQRLSSHKQPHAATVLQNRTPFKFKREFSAIPDLIQYKPQHLLKITTTCLRKMYFASLFSNFSIVRLFLGAPPVTLLN